MDTHRTHLLQPDAKPSSATGIIGQHRLRAPPQETVGKPLKKSGAVRLVLSHHILGLALYDFILFVEFPLFFSNRLTMLYYHKQHLVWWPVKGQAGNPCWCAKPCAVQYVCS
jgi:hypothetical protein